MKLPEPKPAALNVEMPDGAIASVARALPAGAWLDEFEVGEIIGEGSTTIVYAGKDRARAIPVAIAEYMPSRLAQRHQEGQVTPRTSGQADTFAKGLKAFIHETRTLARCNHPSLVRIVRLWEANGTAYRVMPRYPSGRLLDARLSMDEPPDEEAVRALLDALLGALGVFHQSGGGHGKVTPSNILLLADNRPLLLGPGAAGRAITGDRIEALMTSVEPCFAPIEQMVESADIPLRPSVDLYALAGAARYWISGELPQPVFAASRTPRREKLADTVQRLRVNWPQLHYSAALLDALDGALSLYPAERPRDVAQMRARLGTAAATATGSVRAASTAASALTAAEPSSPPPVPQTAANEAVPASPAPLAPVATPDRVTQDFDVVMPVAPDPDPPAASGLAGIDDDASVRTAFVHRARNSRRIAKWSSAVFVLLALLLIGVLEFGREGPVGRLLETLGISRGAGVGSGAAVSASAVGPAAPVPPPVEANAANVKAMPAEPAAADPSASATASASPAGPDSSTLSAAAPLAPAESAAFAQPPGAALTRSAQQLAPRAPANPREACGPRTQFALYRCMKMQCSQRRWSSHAQCQRLRATDSVD